MVMSLDMLCVLFCDKTLIFAILGLLLERRSAALFQFRIVLSMCSVLLVLIRKGCAGLVGRVELGVELTHECAMS